MQMTVAIVLVLAVAPLLNISEVMNMYVKNITTICMNFGIWAGNASAGGGSECLTNQDRTI